MRALRSLPALCLALVATFVFAFAPASAQSRLRDAETEELLADKIAPLVEASELEPGNVEVVLINDPSINAFVAGGQAHLPMWAVACVAQGCRRAQRIF